MAMKSEIASRARKREASARDGEEQRKEAEGVG